MTLVTSFPSPTPCTMLAVCRGVDLHSGRASQGCCRGIGKAGILLSALSPGSSYCSHSLPGGRAEFSSEDWHGSTFQNNS